MPQSTLSEAEVREIVAPYEERIAACLRRGVQAWAQMQDRLGPDVQNRSRACLIFDLITAEARREFVGDPHVSVPSKRGLPFLLIHNTVAVRFKKFRNSRYATSHSSTLQQRQIASHQLLIEEADVAPTWLTAGYLLDDLGTDAQYAMTFADNGHVQYVLDLDGTADMVAEPAVIDLPQHEQDAQVTHLSQTDDEDDDGLVIRSSRPRVARAGDAQA